MGITAPLKNHIESRRGWLVLIVIVMTLIVVTVWLVVSGHTSWQEARAEYQAELQASSSSIDPDFEVVQHDGYLFVQTDNMPSDWCEQRCGTVTEAETGDYQVALPVGYRGSSNVRPEPKTYEPIQELTYWDPIAHRIATATAKANEPSVGLPDVLVAVQSDEVKVGETVFTTPDYIRQSPQGVVVLSEMPVSYERLGLSFGYVMTAQLTRTKSGFEVCVPADYGKLIAHDSSTGEIPATLKTSGCPSD